MMASIVSLPMEGPQSHPQMQKNRTYCNRRGPASSLKLFPVDLPKITDLTCPGFEDTLEYRVFFIRVELKTSRKSEGPRQLERPDRRPSRSSCYWSHVLVTGDGRAHVTVIVA